MADPRKLPIMIDPDEQIQPTKADQVQAYIDSLKAKAQPAIDAVGQVYDVLDKPKQQFIDKTTPQLDLSRNSVTPGGDPRFQQIARTAMDIGLPSPVDALALGAGKALTMAPELAAKMGEFNKLGVLGNEIGSVGKDIKAGKQAADVLAKAKPMGDVAVVPTMQELLENQMKMAGQTRRAEMEAAKAAAPIKQTRYQQLFGK